MLKYNPIENRILAPDEESPIGMVYITEMDAEMIAGATPTQRVVFVAGVPLLVNLPANSAN